MEYQRYSVLDSVSPKSRYRPKILLLASLSLALALLSCSLIGGGDNDSSRGESEKDPVASQSLVPATEAAGDLGSNLPCQNPPPQEVGFGESWADVIEDDHDRDCYWVQVPADLDSITFELSGLTGDLNLFLGYGFMETMYTHPGEFWQSVEAGSTTESITINNPKPGPYILKINAGGFQESSSYQLSISSVPETTEALTGAEAPDDQSCSVPAESIALGSQVEGSIQARDERPLPRSYYCVEVPEGTSTLNVLVTITDGSGELFVRSAIRELWYDRSRSGNERTVTIQDPAAAAYFIEVAALSQGTPSTFELTVTDGG